MKSLKTTLFKKRQMRVRTKLKKTAYGKPRLCVHRSSKNLYAQIIDDKIGRTLASVSTLEKKLGVIGKNNIEVASKLGKEIANRAIKKGVTEVVFDRGGFLFHGRVKALANAARENGLKL
jgi:large subunit ribosomal protein L18